MLRMAKRRRSSGRGLEIRFDENLDGLFAGVDLDTDSRVTKVDLVASPVLSPNDCVRNCCLALTDRRQHYAAFDRSRPDLGWDKQMVGQCQEPTLVPSLRRTRYRLELAIPI